MADDFFGKGHRIYFCQNYGGSLWFMCKTWEAVHMEMDPDTHMPRKMTREEEKGLLREIANEHTLDKPCRCRDCRYIRLIQKYKV